ncbi:cytochrome P-450 cyp509A1 [Blakeslea trispora]|nr:cytochrome P-450 cyp509A1 [Blakeslea trispora]
MLESDSYKGAYLKLERTGWEVYVTNPEDAKYIVLKSELFPKLTPGSDEEDTVLRKFVDGQNLVFLNGQRWKAQRKVANPAFHRAMPVKLFGELTSGLFEVIEKDGKSIVDVSDLLERWTLQAIGKAGFGFDFKALKEKDNAWVKTYNTVNTAMQSPFFFLFPQLDRGNSRFLWPGRRACHREVEKLVGMMDQIIVQKRQQIANGNLTNEDLEENEKDILTLMIESEARGEGIMSDRELRSNLSAFFLAGHDTTSHSLAYTLYHLAIHPEIQEKARQEAIRILGDAPKDVLPNLEQTKQFEYINQVIKESMRISPPVIRVPTRLAAEDTAISSTALPKGTKVRVDIYSIHNNKHIWTHPEKFDPDRFAEKGEAYMRESRDGLAWTPFGNGARQCIGMTFSLNEQRVILPMLLRKYTWSLPKDSIHKNGPISAGIMVLGPVDLEIELQKRY